MLGSPSNVDWRVYGERLVPSVIGDHERHLRQTHQYTGKTHEEHRKLGSLRSTSPPLYKVRHAKRMEQYTGPTCNEDEQRIIWTPRGGLYPVLERTNCLKLMVKELVSMSVSVMKRRRSCLPVRIRVPQFHGRDVASARDNDKRLFAGDASERSHLRRCILDESACARHELRDEFSVCYLQSQ